MTGAITALIAGEIATRANYRKPARARQRAPRWGQGLEDVALYSKR